MTVVSVIAALLVIAGVVLILELTPEQVTNDMMRLVSPKQTLRDQVKIAKGKKKSRKITEGLNKMRTALSSTGKGGQFVFVCAGSLVTLVAGVVLGFLLGNPFLAPVLGAGCCIIPFLYARNTVSYYEKHVDLEMETALSTISTSYIRSDDIVDAVKENINYLKPPIREIFQAFVGDATAISSDTKKAIRNLKERVRNDIFREWCDALIQCQDDRTLKDTLLPIVGKLTDVRIVNTELTTMLSSVRMEYYTMVALVVGNIPLLYILIKDWFRTLMYTIPGKIVIAVCALVILITALFMMKFTKPIQYKR